MKRTGVRVRALMTRICSEPTLERLVDPALADLQLEHDAALASGRKWRSRWIWLAGYVRFLTMLLLHAASLPGRVLQDWNTDDRATFQRALRVGALATAAATFAFLFPPILERSSRFTPVLALHLVPQALALSLPLGLFCGSLWGLNRDGVSRRVRAGVFLAAFTTSCVSFANLAWLLPAANQSFRVAVSGAPVAKGLAEMSLGELRARLRSPDELSSRGYRDAATHYYQRWALAAAPLVVCPLALAVAAPRRRRSTMAAMSGAAIVGYYLVLYAGRALAFQALVTPATGAWLANTVFMCAAVLVAGLRLRTRRLA